ncbi:unnamed protein product, partial [Lampetra planeri]
AISLLTDMVNRPSYNDFTLLENILYSSKRLVETLTMISITAGIRRKTLQPGAELDQEALQEILPKLREKLKVETERRDYSLEWGDIAVPRNRIFGNKWPKSENGKVYVPYKVSLAFFDGDVKKIEEAALEFKKKTCVRFIPRSNETDYIYIHAWEGTQKGFFGIKERTLSIGNQLDREGRLRSELRPAGRLDSSSARPGGSTQERAATSGSARLIFSSTGRVDSGASCDQRVGSTHLQLDREGRLRSELRPAGRLDSSSARPGGSTQERAATSGSARLIFSSTGRVDSGASCDQRVGSTLQLVWDSAEFDRLTGAGSRGSTQAAPHLLCRRARPA